MTMKAVLLLAAFLAAPLARAQGEPGTEPAGFHGMLVLGSETIYASHLPMFNARHRYQAIWEVSFGPEGDEKYRAERRAPANAGQVFTLNPTEAFRLPELTATRTSFKADVFVGHFEREGNRKILPNATVTLRKLVHFHPFKRSHRRPEALTYHLFGSGRERFLVHWISVAPSYDQILVIASRVLTDPLPPGAVFTLPERSDTARLRPGETATGFLVAGQGPEQPFLIKAADLEVTSEFFFEEEELKANELPPLP